MIPESYRTVRRCASGEYEEKRSRFLAQVRPVQTEEEAKAMLAEIRSEHPQARHHVYAYLTDFSCVQRMSDDGEPQGTGGVQLMEPLRRLGYTNVCLVVTRYFGGTLLGAGPLARAYGKAATLALAEAGEATYRMQTTYELSVPYSMQKRVEYEFSKLGVMMEPPCYDAEVRLRFSVLQSEKEALFSLCTELTNGQRSPVFISDAYRPVQE